MLLNMLPQGALATLVVALNILEEASFIVGGRVFAYDDRRATMVLAHDPAVQTTCFVLI